MRYFVPNIRLSIELPPQSSPQDKLGGIPWGLHPNRWPICQGCGKSQSLLAQFVHHPIRLDLGRTGRILSVFQCNHDPGMCLTWEGGSGANACFVTEPEDLADNFTCLPSDLPPVELEVQIVEWIDRDDGITEAQAAHFFAWEKFSQLPSSVTDRVTTNTKLGSVPSWIQSSDEAPTDGWYFVGQLDSTYSFLNPPLANSWEIAEDPAQWEGRSHVCEGANFGDGGIAYIFLRNTPTIPEGWFFWQCG